MDTSSITSKGQVTIPAKIRKLLQLETGQKVKFTCEDHSVTITPVVDDISAAFGLLKATKSVTLTEIEQAISTAASND